MYFYQELNLNDNTDQRNSLVIFVMNVNIRVPVITIVGAHR
jgi:hypothetical protein